MFRFTNRRESHGRALIAIVEGLPADLPIRVDQIIMSCGDGSKVCRGGRMKISRNRVEILSGFDMA